MNRKQRRAVKGKRRGGTGPATQTGTGEARTLFSAALEHFRAGRPADAAAHCDRIIDRHPSFAQAHHLKGMALSRMGRAGEAVEPLRRAVKMRPDVVEAHFDLGVALDAQGDLAGAAACYREAIRLRGDHAEAHCNLGFVLLRQGALDDAIAACRQAIALKPAIPEAYNNLALAFIGQDRPRDAAAAGRQAIELRPDFTEAHNNLGTALRDLGEFDDAIASYTRALEIRPDYADAHYNLAFTYEKWNRLDDARAAAAAGLRANPEHPGINLVAAVCERRAGNAQEAYEQLSRVSFETASPVVHRAAHFELGRLCDRLDDAARAFSHFSAAKRSQAQTWKARNVDKEMWFREIDAAANRFTAEWVQSWTPAARADGGAAPIFVIGFPRSATTLMGRVLDSHPRLQTFEEQPLVATLLTEIAALPGGYPDALSSLDAKQIERLRAAYFHQADACIQRQPGTIIVDQLSLNGIRAGLIKRVFPDAQFVLAVRHPCDVCLSCFMQNFEINEAMAHFLTIEGTAAFYARAMGLWQQYARVLTLDVHAVRYEDLVENFEHEIRRVIDFIGVDWDDSVLGFAENLGGRGRVKTASYDQVAEPIYRRAKYRWRKYESALQPVMETLAPFIESFGYEDS